MILEPDSFPKKEFEYRIKNHKNALVESDIDFSIIQYKSDLYYYAGTGQSCILVIPKDEEPILFGRRDNIRIKEESSIDNIIFIKRTSEIYKHLDESGINVKSGRLGLEGDIIPADMYQKTANVFPEKEAVSIGTILKSIRSVKSENEIKVLKMSGKILDEVFELAPDILKEGMTEIEASVQLASEMRLRGAQPTVRSRDFYTETGGIGLVLSGSNTGISSYTLTATAGPGLHQSNPLGSSFKKLKEEELIFIDFSLAYKGYITDETRCFVIGKISNEIKDRYEQSLNVEKHLANLMKEGISTEKLYSEAYDYAEKNGFKDELMLGGQIPFLGHGVGLELSEPPVITRKSKYILKTGNVIALEPKLIFPYSMVIGSENTYVIRGEKVEQITNSPHRILE